MCPNPLFVSVGVPNTLRTGSAVRILFVCDDCVESMPIVSRFQAAGFKVTLAHSAHDVEQLSKTPVDAVVVTTDRHLQLCARFPKFRDARTVIVKLCKSAGRSAEPPVTVVTSTHAPSAECSLDAVLELVSANAQERATSPDTRTISLIHETVDISPLIVQLA
jgi:hypothetical protein